MVYTTLTALLMAASLASASPMPAAAQANQVTANGFVFEDYSGKLDKSGNKASKRDDPDALGKRNSDYVSSCGDEWVPVRDFTSRGRRFIGYESAVAAFCQHVTSDLDGNPTVIGPGAYTGSTIRQDASGNTIGLDNGNDPSTSGSPGHIEFEIHNKQDKGDHIPNLADCKYYLMKMTQPDANGDNCYGKKHGDTKGGTWQIGSSDISYHALPGAN